jgi:hypothetical protein
VLKTYGAAPYAAELKKLEKEIKEKQQTINEKIGTYIIHCISGQAVRSSCPGTTIQVVDQILGLPRRNFSILTRGHTTLGHAS